MHSPPQQTPNIVSISSEQSPALGPQEWIEWSANLPQGLIIDQATHQLALDHFASYYAPWCMVVDMAAFMRDLALCNRKSISTLDPIPPTRTAHYSPLLHTVVLYLGIYLLRDEWPDVLQVFDANFTAHCGQLVTKECSSPTLSTLRALNLMST